MLRSRKIRIAVFSAAGLLTGIGLLLAALETSAAKRFVLRQGVRLLRGQGIDLQASRLNYGLFPLRLDLRDVRVQSLQASDLPPLVAVDRVSAEVDLRRLIAGAYYLRDATLDNLRVHLVIAADGRDNIPRPAPKTAPSKPTEYLLERLRISGGEFRFDDGRRQIAAVLPLESVEITGDPLTHGHRLQLRTRDGCRVIRAGRSLTVDRLVAESSFTDPRLDFRAETGLNLASLAEFAGMWGKWSGSVNVAVTAGGTLAALTATARVRGDNLAVDQFDHVSLDAAAAYDLSAARIRLDSADVASPPARLRARADLDLSPAARESHAEFTVRDVDLARLSLLMGSSVRIASIASLEGEARWPGLRFDAAAGTASAKMVASRQGPAKDTLPVEAAVRAVLERDRISLKLDGVRAAGAEVTGEVVLAAGKSLSGELRAAAPRVSAALSAAEAFLGNEPGSLAGTGVEGSLSATAQLGGTLDAPAAAVTLAAPDLAAGGLDGIAVDLTANYSPENLSIDRAAVRWQNQTVSAQGIIGLGPGRPLQLLVEAPHFSLPAVLAGLGRGDLPIAGEVNLNAEVKGTADSPDASLMVSGHDLSAYQQPLGQLTARAHLRGRRFDVSGFRLGDGLQAAAEYDLDTGQYQFQAHASDLELSALTLPDGTPVRGMMQLDAAGRGTIDDPSGEVKVVADRVRVGGQDLGRFDAVVKAGNHQAEIEASAPRFNLTAAAKAGLREPYPATAALHLTQSDLAQLPVSLDLPLAGSVSAVVQASGDLGNYEQAAASAEVSQLEVQWNGELVRADGPVIAHYSAGVVTLEKAALIAAGSRIEAAGSWPLRAAAGEGTLHLSAQLDLPGMARLVPGAHADVQGTASVAGEIRGDLRRLEPTLTVAIDSPRIALPDLSPAISNASLKGHVRDGALEIEGASASWGTASATASGIVPFALLPPDLPVDLSRRPGPAHLTADLKGLNLATLPGAPRTLAGSVSAHLEAAAAALDLNAVKATVTFPELQATLGAYSVAQDGASEIGLENGVVRVRHLRLTGPDTELVVSGTAHVAGPQALDLRLDGKLDAAIVAAFTDSLRASGATEIHAAVGGSLAQPQAGGYAQITDGQLSLQNPRLGVEGLNLRVNLEGNRATIARLDGQMNGGALSGEGSFAFSRGSLQDADLSLRARDVALDFPAGLRTVSDIRLRLKSLGDLLALRGSVLIKEGGFTDDLDFDKGILAAATAPRTLDLSEERNPLLDSVRFNVSISTRDPIAVRNNLAKAGITTQLVVLGSPYEPGLAGRLIIEEGGELTLQERRYQVSRGIVTFTSERRIEPNLDIEATTSASNYDITLRISGTPGDTKTELTSNPALPEPDILAILVTGKTLDEIRGQEFQVAQTQVLSYLTGRVGSTIGRQVEKATGLSRVRVEPNLIAAETNPSARLTVGQDLARPLRLVYSMDLVDSSDQIWVVEYDLTRRFVSRGARQSDGSFRFDFHHDLRLGGVAARQRSAAPETRRVGQVALTGNSWFPESRVMDKLKVRPGDRYDFFKLRQGLDRVTRLYAGEGLLESSLRLRREQNGRTVNLELRVDPGPKLDFVFEGAAVPGGVQKQVRRVWSNGVFDAQRTEDAAGVIRSWLIGGRYLAPQVQPSITTAAPDRKRVVFEIGRGPRFEGVEWAFEGAHGIDPKRLREVIESQKLSTDVYTKPARVTDLLTQFYREMGYLDAAIGAPRNELNPDTRTGRVVFPVQEGPLYRVGAAHFAGNQALTAGQLEETAALPGGQEFRPVLREHALQRLREAYWERGYNDAQVDADVRRSPERGLVDLDIRIVENARGVVSEIVVEGNRRTSEGLIRSQMELKTGDPVNLQKVADSRRKLYNTGAFAAVEITREDLTAAESAAPGEDHLMRLRVKVQEVQPLVLSYGAYYDTERGAGGIFDLSNRNFLGGARVLGLRGRYDSELHELRFNFSEPVLSRFPIKTVAGTYVRREINPQAEEVSGFNVDRLGVFAQQEASLGRQMILNYSYKIERSHTYDTGPDPIFDVRLRIASLSATFARDTRDDLLDASRGSFFSHAVQLSPESLGSQVRFVKYFGQYFRYFPLQKPRVELFTNQVLRPRLVYATGVRVGLGTGLGGQEIPLSERFFAGGSTTIRGFAQNSVGPETGGIVVPGGNAMLVLNNELRFPIVKILDGVGFVDVGNVYPKVSDFSLTDVRSAAGFGLRVRTPWLLLRLDYGLKLDRRSGESAGRLFFSIGQAF